MGRNLTIILVMVVVILLIAVTFEIGRANNAEKKYNNALKLSHNIYSLIRAMHIRCLARPDDISGLNKCISEALIKDDFEIIDFRNFNPKTNKTGMIIIKNKGKKSYDGYRFRMLKNGVSVVSGCHIKGDILPDYTCRFPINSSCERGDVLDILYNGTTRVATKNC